jgi:hypothetical protein
MLAVVDSPDGPLAIARCTCRVCGWSGVGSIDIGLKRLDVDGTEWSYDESPDLPCPSCTLHELDIELDASRISAGPGGSPARAS